MYSQTLNLAADYGGGTLTLFRGFITTSHNVAYATYIFIQSKLCLIQLI